MPPAAPFLLLLAERGVRREERARNDLTGATVAAVAEELGVPSRTAEHRLSLADKFEALPARAAEGRGNHFTT